MFPTCSRPLRSLFAGRLALPILYPSPIGSSETLSSALFRLRRLALSIRRAAFAASGVEQKTRQDRQSQGGKGSKKTHSSQKTHRTHKNLETVSLFPLISPLLCRRMMNKAATAAFKSFRSLTRLVLTFLTNECSQQGERE